MWDARMWGNWRIDWLQHAVENCAFSNAPEAQKKRAQIQSSITRILQTTNFCVYSEKFQTLLQIIHAFRPKYRLEFVLEFADKLELGYSIVVWRIVAELLSAVEEVGANAMNGHQWAKYIWQYIALLEADVGNLNNCQKHRIVCDLLWKLGGRSITAVQFLISQNLYDYLDTNVYDGGAMMMDMFVAKAKADAK